MLLWGTVLSSVSSRRHTLCWCAPFVLLDCGGIPHSRHQCLDLSMTFTWKDWGQLDQAQRTLFWEVLLETFRTLVSLEHAIPKPESTSQLEAPVRDGERSLLKDLSRWQVKPGTSLLCVRRPCSREDSGSQQVLQGRQTRDQERLLKIQGDQLQFLTRRSSWRR